MDYKYRGKVVCLIDTQNISGIEFNGVLLGGQLSNAHDKKICLQGETYYIGNIKMADDDNTYIALYNKDIRARSVREQIEIYMGWYNIEDFISLAEYREIQINSILYE